jgi:excisionase family DNA binding protein
VAATTTRYRDDTEALTTRWITLGQACKLLGVNESTLRRWADAGHTRSFRTPGGHRRFSEDDLRAMMAGHGVTTREPFTSISQVALSRIRRRLQRGRNQHWYSGIAEDDRDTARNYGRRLVALVSEYLAKGSRRTELLDEAREILHDYGALLFRDGLSLRDVLEGFTFFRKRLDEAAREEAQKNDLSADEVLEMWEHLSNLADQELLSVAESYDEAAMAAPARR